MPVVVAAAGALPGGRPCLPDRGERSTQRDAAGMGRVGRTTRPIGMVCQHGGGDKAQVRDASALSRRGGGGGMAGS